MIPLAARSTATAGILRALVLPAVALVFWGCLDRGEDDWIGLWSEGDPGWPGEADDDAVDDDVAPQDADGDGWTEADGDCDDADPAVHPGAEEGCDGIDTDCDGAADPGEIDDDQDGASECQGDCDDHDVAYNLLDVDGDGWSTCDGDSDDPDH